MNASVKYNDFQGTVSADISDGNRLNEYLIGKGVDIKKYDAIGASFYANYNDSFKVSFMCIDNEKSNETKKHITQICFEEDEFSKDEFFEMFKRLNVLITQKYGDFENMDIDESILFES